ncbi:Transforming growth factor-beta C-terminal [Trinorchestia longiramus]|nr:Transforming growth factor-beta C-terminal [Trinorchestia longiramus]
MAKERLASQLANNLNSFDWDCMPPKPHQYNVTKEEYDVAYSEYLRAVAMEEAREEELAEARYRRLYPHDVDEDLEEDEFQDGGPEEDGDDSSALAEYKFFSTRITRPSRGRGRRSLPNGDRIAHFHVSVPMSADDIQVVWAKATFFKKGNAAPGPDDPKTVSMQLYRVDDIKKFRAKRKSGGLGKDELLQAFNLTVADDETLEVNMTEAVKSWLESSESDTGVLIRCPDCLSAGVQIRTGGTSHVPTLHVQTRLSATKRVKRSRDMRRATRAKWRQLGDCKDGPLNGRHSSRCCRRSMTVRFDDLPGFDFIAAPKEFDAYYCSGKCPPRYNPANEHALLQSLINMQKKKDVPRPCCAPTDLKGLYILHYDHSGKLKTELWRDVIVTECGCT